MVVEYVENVGNGKHGELAAVKPPQVREQDTRRPKMLISTLGSRRARRNNIKHDNR